MLDLLLTITCYEMHGGSSSDSNVGLIIFNSNLYLKIWLFHCFTCLSSLLSRSPRPLFLFIVDDIMIVEADEAEEAGDADGSGVDTGDAGNDTGDTDGPGNTEDCYSSATRHTSRS